MNHMLRFSAPRVIEIADVPRAALRSGEVRVRTIVSGISAGTELTAYRGTNPYLTSVWDPQLHLFQHGEAETPGYPLDGWGYSEVGEVIEIAPGLEPTDGPAPLSVGDVVWGIWGHRSEGVLPAEKLRDHVLPPGLDPISAAFVRVGAIALNGVLAADLGVGTTVAISGQGVIGLLATRLAVLNGASVIAIDGIASRRERAVALGATRAFEPSEDVAVRVRELTGGSGADAAIEFSGRYEALQEAMRTVGQDGTVIAAGFYQGTAGALSLGEEFHHNRIQVLASQIGSVPTRLSARWDVARLQRTVIDALADGRLDPASFVSHRYDIADAAEAYALLDRDPASALQVILEFS